MKQWLKVVLVNEWNNGFSIKLVTFVWLDLTYNRHYMKCENST